MLPVPLATFDLYAPRGRAWLAAGRGVASAFVILAFGFLLNSVSDRQVDRDGRKNPLIIAGAAGYQYSLAVLLVLSLALAAVSPVPARLAILSCLVLGVVYSIGPRLKSVPVAGSLTNAAGFTLMLFFGMSSATLPAGFGYVALVYATLLLQNQLMHEAGDQFEDRASGIRTTWLTLGPRWTALMAAFAGLGATIAAAHIVPRAAVVPVVAIASMIFVVAFPLLLSWPRLKTREAARLRVIQRWWAVVFGAALYAAWRMGA
ncbi:MAG: hypothetical protein E6J56_21825 [Deltaproteobacteria bacterium]|nr:MAG: hypothetical protein E6J56_21825 [Deltaproteobacteria bacterium]